MLGAYCYWALWADKWELDVFIDIYTYISVCTYIHVYIYLILLHFILLCFTDNTSNWKLNQWIHKIENLWEHCSKKIYHHHFSKSICLLHVSVPHFGNSHNTSDFFVIICYRDLVVTFEVTVIIVLGHHKLHLHKMTNLIHVVCVLTTPDSLPFLGPKTQQYWN